jgi:predicted nucleotidyltransferase
MLSKLLEAMGSELVTAATPLPEHLAALSGPVGLRLRRHRHLIVEAAARYGVESVRVLGAAARGEDRPGDLVELRLDQTPAATLGGHPNLTAEREEITSLSVKITTAQELSRRTRSETDDPGVTL